MKNPLKPRDIGTLGTLSTFFSIPAPCAILSKTPKILVDEVCGFLVDGGFDGHDWIEEIGKYGGKNNITK